MMLRVSAGSIVRAPRVRTRAGLLSLLIVLRPGLHDRPRDALFPPPTGLPSCGLSPHLILEMPKFATSKSSVFARSKKNFQLSAADSTINTVMKVLTHTG